MFLCKVNFLISLFNFGVFFKSYSYSLESCDLMDTLELHSKSCRSVEYSPNGRLLVSCGKEKSIMVTDTTTNKLVQFYDDAHEYVDSGF